MTTKTTTKKMTLKRAEEIAGSLSDPSKMPAFAYGLPVAECRTGAKLASIKGSVCEGCYATKNFYHVFRHKVVPAQYKRMQSISDPLWCDAMVALITSATKTTPYFRWHDSGDIQSVEHLQKIAEIADRMPTVHFWLPTREYRIVAEFLATRECPINLVIRQSAHMVDQPAPFGPDVLVSTVHTSGVPVDGGFACPSRYQDWKCGDCRACWDPTVKSVGYFQHS